MRYVENFMQNVYRDVGSGFLLSKFIEQDNHGQPFLRQKRYQGGCTYEAPGMLDDLHIHF